MMILPKVDEVPAPGFSTAISQTRINAGSAWAAVEGKTGSGCGHTSVADAIGVLREIFRQKWFLWQMTIVQKPFCMDGFHAFTHVSETLFRHAWSMRLNVALWVVSDELER